MPACTNAPKLLYALPALLAPVSFSRPGLRKVFALGTQPRDAGLPDGLPGAVGENRAQGVMEAEVAPVGTGTGTLLPGEGAGREQLAPSAWHGPSQPREAAAAPGHAAIAASPQPHFLEQGTCGGQRLSLWPGGVPPAAPAQRRCHLPASRSLVPPPSPSPSLTPRLQPPEMWHRVEAAAASPQPGAPHGAAPSPHPPLARGQRGASPTSYLCPVTKKRWCQQERCKEHPQEHPQPCRTGAGAAPHPPAHPPCVRRVLHLPLVQSPTVFIFVDLFGLKSCLAIILNK